MSSVVVFGSAGIGKVDQETADRAIQTALDYGVNHLDVAPRYGEAEVRLKPWMPQIRDQVFLGCKTAERTKDEAWASCTARWSGWGRTGSTCTSSTALASWAHWTT